MNILHVTKKYPPALGGDAVVVHSLQKQQQAAGHTVTIATSNCKEIKANTHVYKIGLVDTPERLDAITMRRLVSLVMLIFKMFVIVRTVRPDVIHTHSIDMAFCSSFAARWFKVPMVHTFHIVTFYDTLQSPLRRKTELWLAKKAKLNAITAPNHYDAHKLHGGGLPQTTLLPNGVDITFWRNRSTTIAKDKVFTFVTVGRLEQQKGYDFLIKAAAKLARLTDTPFRVIIIGEGSQRPHLEQLIRATHTSNIIKIMGRKDPHQIRTQFASADAAVCTSLYETTPLTLLEAWAAGLPVITTPVGIVRNPPATFTSAFMVSPQNEIELATTMQQCMTNESLRHTVAQSGYNEVQKYAWPAIAQTAEDIYRKVL